MEHLGHCFADGEDHDHGESCVGEGEVDERVGDHPAHGLPVEGAGFTHVLENRIIEPELADGIDTPAYAGLATDDPTAGKLHHDLYAADDYGQRYDHGWYLVKRGFVGVGVEHSYTPVDARWRGRDKAPLV